MSASKQSSASSKKTGSKGKAEAAKGGRSTVGRSTRSVRIGAASHKSPRRRKSPQRTSSSAVDETTGSWLQRALGGVLAGAVLPFKRVLGQKTASGSGRGNKQASKRSSTRRSSTSSFAASASRRRFPFAKRNTGDSPRSKKPSASGRRGYHGQRKIVTAELSSRAIGMDIVLPTTSIEQAPWIISREKHEFSRRFMSSAALKVLNKLQAKGYQAYLVGGGVRDVLLGKRPKDFDVVTNAHPEQVRELFQNCRLIGRRFRLAHKRYIKLYLKRH